MNELKKLPIGIQTFDKIIEGNFLYIDKTKYFEEIVNGGYYFLSRPRRFGKSLLLSTLKEILKGNKELFEGLYIYDKIKWEEHPIIHLDFSVITYKEGPERFKASLEEFLEYTGEEYGIVLEREELLSKFMELVEKLSEKNKVVILIDEYDKPIIDCIGNNDMSEQNRNVLMEFYGVIKGLDQYLKLVFLTGVSKFSKVSVFSKLNNLKDITLTEKTADICGYTQGELKYYFHDRIKLVRESLNVSEEKLLNDIKFWYNGYSWDGRNRVYNPWSILNFFDDKTFTNYWFATGTPGFLIEVLKKKKVSIEELENKKLGQSAMESFDINNMDPNVLLFQTGYLTIKKRRIDKKTNKSIYYVNYPNYEVKESLINHLLANFIDKNHSEVEPIFIDLLDYLEDEDMEKFLIVTKSIFAGIPSHLHLTHEYYYHSIFYMILVMLGADIDLEVNTDKGRIDGVIEFDELIYIIEFKLGEPEKGLSQIKEKKYYEKYLSKGKKVKLIGIGGFREKNIGILVQDI